LVAGAAESIRCGAGVGAATGRIDRAKKLTLAVVGADVEAGAGAVTVTGWAIPAATLRETGAG
jgi:hypothetical protein